jgi:hemolysin III
MSSTAEWIRSESPVETAARLCSNPDPDTPRLTPEERANQLTHGLGFVLSLFGAASLLPVCLSAHDPRIVYGCSLYMATLVALYAASLLSHSFGDGRARYHFRLLDQVCIYLLIAGTVTPMALAYWSPWMLATLLVGVWSLALIGIVRKLAIEGPDRVTLWVYVLLGWLPVMGIGPILAQLPIHADLVLVGGGLCYSAGTYFWLSEGRIPYSHAVWHTLVLIGTAAHFAIVRWYVAENSPLVAAITG